MRFDADSMSYLRFTTLLLCLLVFNPSAYTQVERIAAYFESIADTGTNPSTVHFIQEEAKLVEDYSKLQQIILVRHGEPALNKHGSRKRTEAVQFVHAYDSVGIYPPAFVPVKLEQNELTLILTSSIPRAISTAEQVFQRTDIQRPDSVFREFERKILGFPNLKLPLKWWLTSSRVLWFMGMNKGGIERFSEAKKRARLASSLLEQDAAKQGKTLLVAHGLLNRYLVKSLQKKGWTVVFDGGNGYLSQRVLVRYEGSNDS